MIKRFIFYSILIALLITGTYRVYLAYKPQRGTLAQVNITYNIPVKYSSVTIDDLIRNSHDNVCVLFYDSSTITAQYVFNTYLTNIIEDHNLTEINGLFFCDLNGYQPESLKSTKIRWGFYNTPTFVNMKFVDENVEFLSILEWNNDSHYNQYDVEKWLTDQSLLAAHK